MRRRNHHAQAGRPALRQTGGLRHICAMAFAFAFLLDIGWAAETLEATLVQPGLRARTAAAIPVEVRFKWDGTRLLEGRLELEFKEGNRVLGYYRSGDLALTTGKQQFRMLLPPLRIPHSDSQIEARMKFVTRAQTLDLGFSTLFIPTSSERSLVLAWCDSALAAGRQDFPLQQSLIFERMNPATNEVQRYLLSTSLTRITPEELPARSLGCTAFDVMVLTAEGLKETRERQLETLVRWVKGGGSLCVFVSGPLQPHHVRFLDELAEASPGAPKLQFDGGGNPIAGQLKILRLNAGTGRAVLVTGDLEPEPGLRSIEWRRAVTFLWRLRANHVEHVTQTGHWDPNAMVINRGPRNWSFPEMARYSVQPSGLNEALTTHLMPSSIRLIPFSALAVLLGIFLLVIGPADYFLLGALRRRRFTWVLFPLTCLGFMVAAVAMANHYLGLRDERRSLIIVDMGHDGTPLRWNRYELLFAARDKQWVEERRDVLWSPLEIHGGDPFFDNSGVQIYVTPGGRQNFRRRGSMRGEDRVSSSPVYEGAVPFHFRTHKAIRQWQPELSRTFSLEPPPVPFPAEWRDAQKAWPDLKAIRARLSKNRPFLGDVHAILPNAASGSHVVESERTSGGILPETLLEPLCVGESGGFLSLVSRVSPTGGANFEDAGGMDFSTGESALLIVTRNDDDIILYRWFFHER